MKLFERGLRNFHRIRVVEALKYFCFINRAIRRWSFTIVCRFFLSSLQLERFSKDDEWSFRASHASVHIKTRLFFVYTLDSCLQRVYSLNSFSRLVRALRFG